jgi:hypothetical protein
MAEQIEPIIVVAASPGGHAEGLKAARNLLPASAIFGPEDRRRQQEKQEDEQKNGYGYGKCAHEKFSAG